MECMEACVFAASARNADMVGSAGQRLTGQIGGAPGRCKRRSSTKFDVYRGICCFQHVLVRPTLPCIKCISVRSQRVLAKNNCVFRTSMH